MGKRKVKSTLTKIDPSLLKPKPYAISQHAAENGERVTTNIRPAHQPPEDLPNFAADTSSFNEEYAEGDETDDDISRGYYVARVCSFPFFLAFCTHRLTTARTTRFYYGCLTQ